LSKIFQFFNVFLLLKKNEQANLTYLYIDFI